MSDDRVATAPLEHRGARWKARALAATLGVLCHSTFVLAVSSLAVGLYCGMASGHGRARGLTAFGLNALLAVQFPLLHSFLLTRRGQGTLVRMFGREHGRDFAPTSYAWIAAVQILATFALWSPSGIVWWRPQGAWLFASIAAYAAAWLFLLKALSDAGPGLQTGWIGWTAVWRGRRVQYPPMARTGLFSVCRQPIYLGFAMTLWTGPVWTPDRLLLALIWTSYCVFGPRRKEARYATLYGESFREYRRGVPYMAILKRKAA